MARKVTKLEWQELMGIYAKRANLEMHRAAAAGAAGLAATYPEDREVQLFCAITQYYCAHRLTDHGRKKEVASQGVAAAGRMMKLDPGDYDARYWWVLNQFQARMAEGIPAALREARKIRKYIDDLIVDEPERFEAYMMKGVLYRELPPFISWGDKKAAVKMLEKAASIAPRDPEVLLELAAAYAKVKKKDKARVTYQKVIHESTPPPNREWETEDAREYALKMLKKL